MALYRSPMEKILKQMENDTIINNTNEPIKAFFRKILYRLACGGVWLKMVFSRRSKDKHT